MIIVITQAILALNPDAEVLVTDEDIDNIIWYNNTPEISKADILAKQTELQAEYDNQEYARKRKAEYPEIYDYIDGVVKDDQEQINKYIADCQAVKDKYEKP
jgi:hypothetical protein